MWAPHQLVHILISTFSQASDVKLNKFTWKKVIAQSSLRIFGRKQADNMLLSPIPPSLGIHGISKFSKGVVNFTIQLLFLIFTYPKVSFQKSCWEPAFILTRHQTAIHPQNFSDNCSYSYSKAKLEDLKSVITRSFRDEYNTDVKSFI